MADTKLTAPLDLSLFDKLDLYSPAQVSMCAARSHSSWPWR